MIETLRNIKHVCHARKWYTKHGEGQYYGDYLDAYDRAADRLTQRGAFAEVVCSKIEKTSGKTLELAAGTGLISEPLSKVAPHVTFTDISPEALQKLQERVPDSDVVCASFYELPFLDDSFETVVNVGGYRYVDTSKKKDFWKEVSRVTQPDGQVLIGQFYPRAANIQGSDIRQDITSLPPDILHEGTTLFDAQLQVFSRPVRTGTYHLFAFRRR